jgi:hypothetical protein
MKKTWVHAFAVWFVVIAGCAGTQRGCAAACAENYGADWIVVQMDMNGSPYRCWTLENTSITNEDHSDGIYWLSPRGHLVHISGHYNRVQVAGGHWDDAFSEVGMTRAMCDEVQAQRLPPRAP